MAATFDIVSTQAVPDIACVSSTGQVIFPTKTTIWDAVGNYTDGDTGSRVPVMFHTPQAPIASPFVKIEVTGTCKFPASRTGQQYVLSMMSDSGTTVLQSKPVDVPPDTGSNIVVTELLVLAPNGGWCPLPFRWAGDFTWTISLATSPIETIYATQKTRLELCWARSPPPDGPTNPPLGVPARINLSPGYPIGAFRLFAPCPTEIPSPPAVPVNFYIDRTMNLIWNPGSINPRYDTTRGGSYYNMNTLGGSFNLDWWIKKMYPSCNCYDLAGIAQLACGILVDEKANELVDSRYVWQNPNGFINPGPLYGWVPFGGLNLQCNSPFWTSKFTEPYVDPASNLRTPFLYHAWVEITRDGNRGVLDATHALEGNPPIPNAGTLNRLQYLNATLDPTRSSIDPSTRENDKGACWINPETRLLRLGVTDAAGMPNPDPPQLSILPPDYRRDLELTLERGKSPVEPEPRFNTSQINPAYLLSHFFPTPDPAHDPETAISITPSAVRSVVKHQPLNTPHAELLNLTITAFDAIDKPLISLTHYLLGFQSSPLSSFVNRCEPPLGSFSFATENSIFWVRGNVFLLLNQHSSSEPSSDVILPMAVALDKHLAARGLRDPPPPIFRLFPPTDAIHRGDVFTIKVSYGDQRPVGEVSVESGNLDVVIPGGWTEDNGGGVECFASGEGETVVKVHKADGKSLMPGVAEVRIVVEGK